MINSFRDKYFFLSNFYPTTIIIDSITYPTLEHAYQATKAVNEEDKKWISNADSPGEAKKRGNEIVCREDWENIKLVVMKGMIYLKFCGNPNLLKQLIETRDEELIEGNWWHDTFWGVCNGIGKNHLGKILMEVRKELK